MTSFDRGKMRILSYSLSFFETAQRRGLFSPLSYLNIKTNKR